MAVLTPSSLIPVNEADSPKQTPVLSGMTWLPQVSRVPHVKLVRKFTKTLFSSIEPQSSRTIFPDAVRNRFLCEMSQFPPFHAIFARLKYCASVLFNSGYPSVCVSLVPAKFRRVPALCADYPCVKCRLLCDTATMCLSQNMRLTVVFITAHYSVKLHACARVCARARAIPRSRESSVNGAPITSLCFYG